MRKILKIKEINPRHKKCPKIYSNRNFYEFKMKNNDKIAEFMWLYRT